MKFLAAALIFCGVVASSAQTPVVPHKMHFAGMTLSIRDDARREIQKDVDALTQSPKYFNIKVERARTYFPIIEKIFQEERVPDDFKFLCLQESALIADAVSVSDAVGFWQFKDFTAREMGMRVDELVDERMNIVSSSRGAARYIKQNNFMFNNWIYALQAYQMGAGGVKRMVGDVHDGSRHMEITSDTYWYVKKFLAHKVAFEEAVKKEAQFAVEPMEITNGSTIADLLANTAAEEAKLREFNKWIKKDVIPTDKSYYVILPKGKQEGADFHTLLVSKPKATPPAEEKTTVLAPPNESKYVNDIPVIEALPGETLSGLAKRAGIDPIDLMKFNDVEVDHKVKAGSYYFLDRKKTRSEQEFHKIKDGENLWQVSQQYGLQIKRLKKYNHLQEQEQLAAGTIIWLSGSKPKEPAALATTDEVVELEPGESFDWVDITTESIPLAGQTHQVKTGETLYSIAKTYQVSVSALQAANQMTPEQAIKVGQSIKLPVNEIVTGSEPLKETETAIIHEVKSSETLYSVARQYGVTIKELMECNDKSDLSVSVGEKLRIPPR
jgi:membrane-bound lytic murein transglycosylase D